MPVEHDHGGEPEETSGKREGRIGKPSDERPHPEADEAQRDHLTKGGPPLAPADVAPQDGGPEEPNPCQRGEVRGSELLEEPAGPQLGLRDMRLGGGLERLAAYVTLAANVALSAR